ncbi:MAG: cytochrome c oxidase subunit II [Flavobacteriales bacterium]|jgi:cytochrome c oxidase subunit 2|tara:strand:- start:173 stop:1495 length:1323 start_codon:yes stop_codon:yes gene_type:complete
MKLLILLVIVVGVIAVAQLAKIYQLSARLRGHREEEISEADTRMNGALWIVFMIVFYATTIWQFVRYGDYLPPAASAHGESVDTLMNFNLAIIIFVFFVVNTLLFIFPYKYRYNKNRKALFLLHDSKLELIWTVVPSIVLAVIIIFGLKTWTEMTGPASDDAIRIEIYSKQFDWTARYSGDDGQFGATDFNLITPSNPLGIITEEGVMLANVKLTDKIAKLQAILDIEKVHLLTEKAEIEATLHGGDAHGHDGADSHEPSPDHTAHLESRLHDIETVLSSGEALVMTEAAYEAKEDKIYRLERHLQRILELQPYKFSDGLSGWEVGKDDRIVKGEFHLPIGREIEFIFRSRDVIHSAFMPHFRAQMNTVPGLPTRFKLTPTITTDSMRTILDNPDFNYILLCNKICGSAHFNMAMDIVVESQEKYDAWLAEQKVYIAEQN